MLGPVLAAVIACGTAAACALPLLLTAAVTGDQAPPSEAARRQIPPPLLAAYQQAPGCQGLPWQVVAAIGWIESRHATIQGARLDPDTGRVAPRIVGIPLDGDGTAAIRTPTGGSPWHEDLVWDHAVGPMQFITATWMEWGVDASGDGLADPHNAYDAIAAAGRYLCNHRRELVDADAVKLAVRRYNNSDSYVKAVLEQADAYGTADGGDPVASPIPNGAAKPGTTTRGSAAPMVDFARAQLGDSYVWGAEGPDAYDCSGLTLAAARRVGIRLPHRSALQVRYGQAVNWRREAIQPGDLIFLRGGRPVHDHGHVGIATGPRTWINAPRAGLTVNEGPVPVRRIQAVRRLVQ